jgi:putative acetyltransferase
MPPPIRPSARSPAGVTVTPANSARDLGTIRRLFREYERAIGVDLDYQDFEAEWRTLPGRYAPPGGVLLLGRARGGVAGCAAVRPGPGTSAELKRVYVRPRFRHAGVGRTLVDRAIEFAAKSGYRSLVLDTLPDMKAAYRLYVRLGFLPVAPFGPPARPGTRYLRLELV